MCNPSWNTHAYGCVGYVAPIQTFTLVTSGTAGVTSAPRISDGDVERIARRVVELLAK